MKTKCYMCDNIATSREHVPPLCLFPEMKDTKGINFRKNLITVPSCDTHNSKKSDDDEFLMLSLSGLLKNNPVGNLHQITKANRSIRRKNKDFIEQEVLRNRKFGKLKTKEGNYVLIAIGNPNYDRIEKCLKHIAYGLYYHEFQNRFNGTTHMLLEFIEYNDNKIQTLKKFIKHRFEVEKELNLDIKGDNPEVFYYQFHKPDNFGIIGLKLVFYGTAEAYISFKDNNSETPFDLGMHFINEGIHTIINLGDKNFEFNK